MIAQLLGSLVAILALAGLARWLGLGGGGIDSEAAAIAEAEASFTGFRATRATLSSDGASALVAGADGSFVVLKRHGAHLAGRRVGAAQLAETPEGWRVDPGDARFGSVLVRR
ncbi:MAG: hypothetical protein A4S12_12980 [Proteobacteria bacterium SG_bin5]|nr:hypothetical protein [Sphingomonas sp.]OQW45193.1 MAG: hypothetical protein A4S12_12980 [Proteobacteria bacterium SG_bin5]